jgi:peptidoglycan/LPS O-acetylase OafA/YrhL
MDTATRVLTVYSGALAAVLLGFLFLIARFYERTSGERSHYRWFLAPAGLFLIAAARYAITGGYTGDPFGDLCLLLGGISLIALGYFLSRLMMGRRR